MIQRILTFVFLITLLSADFALADTSKSAIKNPETSFQEGQVCLIKSDIACAKLIANIIPAQSPYAKLLIGNIAAAEGDFDRAFRLLLPLQTAPDFPPPARASLHASLALAYEKQSDTLRALEQRTLAESNLADPKEIETSQQLIWQLLVPLSREQLINLRGESDDTVIQGWIDLALANHDTTAQNAWRSVYPDHPASRMLAKLSVKLALTVANPVPDPAIPSNNLLKGPVALLLPLSENLSDTEARAAALGFSSAQKVAGNHAEIKVYTARNNPEEIAVIYQRALMEGAQNLVDLFSPDDTANQSSLEFVTIQQQLPGNVKNNNAETANPATPPKVNILTLKSGLSPITDVNQLVNTARNFGMQTATIISTENASASQLAKVFGKAWMDAGGQIKLHINLVKNANLADIKTQTAVNPADMIILTTQVEESRAIRPYLDIATPIFGFSTTYAGMIRNPLDAPLSALRFLDMPWMITRDNAEYDAYRSGAVTLTSGTAQRWYALGVDAYMLLSSRLQNPTANILINGLSGKLQVGTDGKITRELVLGRFNNNGVVPEQAP